MSLLERIRERNKVLDACPGHVFERVLPSQMVGARSWACVVCNETVDPSFATAYLQGLKHAAKSGHTIDRAVVRHSSDAPGAAGAGAGGSSKGAG